MLKEQLNRGDEVQTVRASVDAIALDDPTSLQATLNAYEARLSALETP